MSPTESSAAARRFDAVDIARAVAVMAMVVYHFSWDLSSLDFVETNVVADLGWRIFARCIAASFLINLLTVTAEIGGRPEELVLRTDAPSSLAVSHGRAAEFALLRAAHGAGVTVPCASRRNGCRRPSWTLVRASSSAMLARVPSDRAIA